tara:strand:- start:1091 stop:1639 length:549 start_codon:yes stop_codon:yes gene_type:complete
MPIKIKPRRDGVWQMIRKLKEFTIYEIMDAVKMDYSSIRTYVRQLEAGGYVEEQKAEKFQKKVYTLIKDVGVHRPVLKANGKPRKPTANQRMWMSMKALKRFSYYDVSITAEVPKGNARSYLKALHRAEYLDLCKQHTHVSAQQYLFKASNDTGPKAPQIRRDKSVYDQNLHKVVWPKGGAA